MKQLMLATLLVWLTACAGTQKAAAPSPKEAVEENTYAREREEKPEEEKKEDRGDGAMRRVVVSFYSKGAGTDAAAINNFLDFVANFENHNQVKISPEKTPWGREGEVDYCMDLENMDSDMQAGFVVQMREILSQSQLVHISEYAPCLHAR